MKKSFRITITPRTGRLCTVREEEWSEGRWKLINLFNLDSQDVSSKLILERENVSRGLYNLEIVDHREHFMMV